MPITNTPKPQYPNVPNAPGVPSIPRNPSTNPLSGIVLIASDAAQLIGLFLGPQWGLFTSDGAPAFSAIPGISGILGGIISAAVNLIGAAGLSVGEVEFRNDMRIATAPQEEGAFVSYNQVSNPFNGRVTYIISGIAAQRGAFIASVAAMMQSLTLVSLVMPEYVWPSCKVMHYDLRRTAIKGLTMFAVEIWVEEVRITGTSQFSNTQTPSGAAPVSGGTVQPATPTPTQTPPLGTPPT